MPDEVPQQNPAPQVEIPMTSAEAQQPSEVVAPAQTIMVGDVHTMPERYGASQRKVEYSGSGGGSGKRLFIVIGIVFIVLAGVTGGAYWYITTYNPFSSQPSANQPQNQNAPQVNTNQPANTNTTNSDTNQPVDAQVQERDARRVNDLITIGKALDAYKTRYSAYPQFLALLPQDLLKEVPKDPLTKIPYTYTPTSDRASYEIIFDVEVNAVFKGKSLPKGTYKFSPDSFKEEVPPINTNVNQPVATTTEPTPQSEKGNLDTDGDGLTLFEERVFQTSPDDSDTDHDGYKDGVEVMNFYSPIQTGAIKLDQAGLVKRYADSTNKFSFWYPAAWIVGTAGDTTSEINLTTGTGEDIAIKALANPDQKTSWEWYIANVSSDYDKANVDIITVGGHEAVRTKDERRIIVIAVKDKVYTMVYHANSIPTYNYPTIYTFIQKYFTIEG